MIELDDLSAYLRSHGWTRTIELARYSSDRQDRKVFRWSHPQLPNSESSASQETAALASALEAQIRAEAEIGALQLLLETGLGAAGWRYRRDWGRVLADHHFEQEMHIWEWHDPFAEEEEDVFAADDEPELEEYDPDDPYAALHALERFQLQSGIQLDLGRTLRDGRLSGYALVSGWATRTYFYRSALCCAVGLELQRQGSARNIY